MGEGVEGRSIGRPAQSQFTLQKTPVKVKSFYELRISVLNAFVGNKQQGVSVKKEAQGLVKKADDSLMAAESPIGNAFAEDAAAKIYYAMFYATQALLKSEGIDVVKHSAVESALGSHFAKTARIDPKYHRLLINARKIRGHASNPIPARILDDFKVRPTFRFAFACLVPALPG